jgi:hypothetical protein
MSKGASASQTGPSPCGSSQQAVSPVPASVPCAGAMANHVWRSVAKFADFNVQPVWRGAELPPFVDYRMTPLVQDAVCHYWEFRREPVYDRGNLAGEPMGFAIFARKPPEAGWLPLDANLAELLTKGRAVLPRAAALSLGIQQGRDSDTRPKDGDAKQGSTRE